MCWLTAIAGSRRSAKIDPEDCNVETVGAEIRFIDDLESTGLIVQVGEWVVRSACAQAHAWSDSLGVALDIHVNVSARQLSRTDFPHVVRRALCCPRASGYSQRVDREAQGVAGPGRSADPRHRRGRPAARLRPSANEVSAVCHERVRDALSHDRIADQPAGDQVSE